MADIKYINNKLGIQYNKLVKPQITTGYPFAVEPYQVDEEGNLIKYPLPIINATDINWGGAEINNTEINTTDELLKLISTKGTGDGGSGGNDPYIPYDNESVIGVMLSAIRALQAEVVKLRNSLVDGIYSYTGKQTKMSKTIHDYDLQDIDSEEPLWAVDETTLSEIISVDLTTANQFENNENIEVNIENNTLTFNELSIWKDTLNLLNKVTDPKIYIYLESNGLDITFNLKEINNEESDNILHIKLNQLVNSNEENLYNILFILATSVDKKINNVNKLVGDNFVWIQVGHYIYDGIQQGYYNKTTNTLQDNIITFDNTRYIIDSIDFNNLTLSKFNIYSKYQNFSNEVESTNINENDRYKVAHITIRAIDTYENLVEIKDELPENELIYVENGNTLYIKNGYKIKKLGLGGNSTPEDPDIIDTMTNKELIEALKQMGIVYEHYSENADSHDYDLELAALDSVTFINQATGKKFDISVDAYGKLKSVEQNQTESLIDRLGETTINSLMTKKSVRGFVANVRAIEENKNAGDSADMKLLSDRVKIGAIYAPLDSEEVFGCSHAYIELENTSDKDFPLDNCYIHYCKWNSSDEIYNIYHLALDGYIPAGGTYLIRGKKYVKSSKDANVFINVDSYDKEWYINNELIDFTMNDERSNNIKHSWSFALTYGNENIIETTALFEKKSDTNTPTGETADTNVYVPGFIDAISVNSITGCKWAGAAFTQIKNCIYKNTFELDPAKQAFNGLHSKDSSRVRWANAATDFQYVLLNKDVIEFPQTKEVKHVSDYTPKASFENKNVCTDKTQFDIEKPNMPTVSFGIDAFKTRCFNWLSAGQFDEYVFIKNDNGTWKHFESYKQRNDDTLYEEYENNTTYPKRKEFHYDICNIAYCQYDGSIKESKRITSKFPATNIFYTSHKCIIDILSDDDIANLSTPKTYTYVVGRADKNGDPDFNHCSKEMHFTMYPKSYTPRIFQTTDQQGFHWIEYQAWGAAAIKLNDIINDEIESNNNIIPVLINTGDMTQSGARINEWLDYYKAGECLFDHLEQMNIVGNNDLCGTDITILGTGDDLGKSNGWFYYISYCYEVPNNREIDLENNIYNIAPIVNDTIIPSLYYFDFNCNNDQNYRMVMMNSELTLVNCKDWFKLGYGDDYTANIYTGFAVKNKFVENDTVDQTYLAETIGFTPIYTILYYILNCHKVEDTENPDTTKYLVFCHEMPFTVITHANIAVGKVGIPRSVNGNNTSGSSLVGSKLNQLVWYENEENGYTKGTYWFSRLLEYKGVKLCIGGHKHTYCVTYPLRENYQYGDLNSIDNGPMAMDPTLKDDNVVFTWNETKTYEGTNIIADKDVDHTKFPLTYRDDVDITNDSSIIFPYTYINDNHQNHAVIYFMSQATGYKLTSNKELPTAQQKFTKVLPQTNNVTEKPNANQRYPMFVIYELDNQKINIKLGRIHEILNDSDHTFTQLSYGKNNMYISYMKRDEATNDYGKWMTETALINDNKNCYIFEPINW